MDHQAQKSSHSETKVIYRDWGKSVRFSKPERASKLTVARGSKAAIWHGVYAGHVDNTDVDLGRHSSVHLTLLQLTTC